ncbi:hypothetical protein amrb99_35240 [Actinomadura sp. RB99]|nr:hypothetical protein [Actinomadura sp. RB99]
MASGYRPPQITPVQDYLDPSRPAGYPELLGHPVNTPRRDGRKPHPARAESNGCQNIAGVPVGYRTFLPAHVKYGGSQLAFAVHYLRAHPHMRLVTGSAAVRNWNA